MQRDNLFRLDGAIERDPAIDRWFAQRPGPLGDLARAWFEVIRASGDEFRERLHGGCPTACLGNVAFASVAIYKAHVTVGFFQGSALPDPARLLQGEGKFMRHVKLRPGAPADPAALRRLIEAAWLDVKHRVELG